jgi:plastocyanin
VTAAARAGFLVLAAGLLLALAPGPAPSDAAAKAAHPAAKKHARKHRRVVKRIRWRARTAALQAGVGALLDSTSPGAPGSPGGSQPGGSGPTAPPVFHTLSVQSREYSLTLSRTLLTPGTQTIQLNNRGEDPHDLVVSPEGTHTPLAEFPETGPDANHTEQLQLPAGRYYLWCSLPEHEGNGMKATLRVE